MAQERRSANVWELIAVIDDWTSKGKSYSWNKTPAEVVAALAAASNGEGRIEQSVANSILLEAETVKMIGNANAGMAWIRQQWRPLFSGVKK